MLNMLQKLLEDETGGSSSSLSEMAALRGLELLELPAEPELQTGWKIAKLIKVELCSNI